MLRAFSLFCFPRDVAATLGSSFPAYSRFIIVVMEYGITDDDWIGAIHRSQYRYRRREGELVEASRKNEFVGVDSRDERASR